MARFEHIKHNYPNQITLHVHLCSFQSITCQRTNYYDTTKPSRYTKHVCKYLKTFESPLYIINSVLLKVIITTSQVTIDVRIFVDGYRVKGADVRNQTPLRIRQNKHYSQPIDSKYSFMNMRLERKFCRLFYYDVVV